MQALIPDTSVPVLVLRLTNHIGLAVARSLGRLGVEVYGIYRKAHVPGAVSRYLRGTFEWHIDPVSPAESVDFLLSLAERIGRRPILVTTADAASVLIAQNERELEQAFRFPRPPPAVVSNLTDKAWLHQACQEHDIPTPDILGLPRSRQEAASLAERATYPVVLKAVSQWVRFPRLSTHLVHNPGELVKMYDRLRALSDDGDIILQEYVASRGCNWGLNGYFDQESRSLAVGSLKKLREYPAWGGETTLGISAANPIIEEYAKRLMRGVGYQGVVNMDFCRDQVDGAYKLVDVNPRLGAPVALFEDPRGLDIPRILYLHLTGQPVRVGPPRQGKVWIREDRDVAACRVHFRDRLLTPRGWVRSLRSVDETAWWARDDPRPFARAMRTFAIRFSYWARRQRPRDWTIFRR